MNDPGLDQPIAEGAKDVENTAGDNVEDQSPDGIDNDDEAYLEPSRWWFASTAFPLIAGTFGPMASAFNICALVPEWRVIILPGQSEDNGNQIPDPQWLIGVNALSLALALIANLALLFNMARRLPFSIAQSITIVGWYASSFLLMGLVIAAHYAPSMQLPPEDNSALTQAFYYAIISSILYFIIASLMCITVYGAVKGHYPKAFKLTMSQRTLMLQTISYLVYLLAGGAVFAYIEDWLFLNGVYWANTTLLTIGVGDFSPTSHLGQSLLIPYAIGGIVSLGLVIGSIRSLVLERGKKKLGVRMIEKKREKIIKQIEKNDGVVKVNPLQPSKDIGADDKPQIKRRKREFEVMRMVQKHASVKRKWYSFIISLLAWFVLWFIGALVFWLGESGQQGMTYFESLYFAYTSLLTIGYGDYAPVANSSKAFFVFWSLMAIPTLTILISNMGDTVIKLVKDATLYVSEFSILPGDESARDRVRRMAQKTSASKFLNNEKIVEEPAGGAFMAETNRAVGEEEDHRKKGTALHKAADNLGEDFQQEELNEIEEARRQGDKIGEDKHLYHYLLVKEIRRVMMDMDSNPPKKYTYREWEWFLRLLGENERDSRFHRPPQAEAHPEDFNDASETKADTHGLETGKQPWSWIGPRSPLLGNEDESEWLLEKLSQRLERLLHREHRSQQSGKAADREVASELRDLTAQSSAGSDSAKTLDHEKTN